MIERIGLLRAPADRRGLAGRHATSALMPTRVSVAADLERELFTAGDFLAWLTPERFADLIDGEIFVDAAVSLRHADLLNFLDGLLRAYIDRHRLGFLYRESVAVRHPAVDGAKRRPQAPQAIAVVDTVLRLLRTPRGQPSGGSTPPPRPTSDNQSRASSTTPVPSSFRSIDPVPDVLRLTGPLQAHFWIGKDLLSTEFPCPTIRPILLSIMRSQPAPRQPSDAQWAGAEAPVGLRRPTPGRPAARRLERPKIAAGISTTTSAPHSALGGRNAGRRI